MLHVHVDNIYWDLREATQDNLSFSTCTYTQAGHTHKVYIDKVSTSDPWQKQIAWCAHNSLASLLNVLNVCVYHVSGTKRECRPSVLPCITQTDSSLVTCCHQPLSLCPYHSRRSHPHWETSRPVVGMTRAGFTWHELRRLASSFFFLDIRNWKA